MPVPTLMLSLGMGISHLLYKQFLLLRHQPGQHKRVVWFTLLCNTINLALSLALAFAMSYAVYFFLTDLSWLFIFNFLFCIVISFRWFDFSHRLLRSFIHRLSEQHNLSAKTTGDSVFILLFGLRKSIGWGAGLTPVFVDAGEVDINQETLRFKGLFLNLKLSPDDFQGGFPISSEQISLIPRKENHAAPVDRYLLVVRDQFYPFRCRETRDLLLSRISPQKTSSKETSISALPLNNPTTG